MPSVQILNNITTCSDIGSLWKVVCLPKRINCFPGCRDMILTPCGSNYNCTKKQGHPAYFLPVLASDKFQIQTNFVDDFNPDPSVPVTGWGSPFSSYVSASLYDSTGVVSTDVTAFTSRRMVGWDGSASYQIIEIDAALVSGLINGNCFSISIFSHNASNVVVDSICTQDFKIEVDCGDTILIGSSFSKTDCCKSWYGSPVAFVGDSFNFDNTMRYRGSIDFTGGSVAKTTQRIDSNIKSTRGQITELYEIKFKDAIPDFLAKQLLRVHMSGKSVIVNGETYYIDDFSIENALKCNFNFPIEIYKFCENKFNC